MDQRLPDLCSGNNTQVTSTITFLTGTLDAKGAVSVGPRVGDGNCEEESPMASSLFNNILRGGRAPESDADGSRDLDPSVPATTIELIPEPDDDSTDDSVIAHGLHSVLKKTDYWFNLELSQLERGAKDEADVHARAGLPRADVPALEELPAETVLRERATRLYFEWSERVKRKIQDAIQSASISAGDGLLNLRYSYDQLERATQRVESTEKTLTNRREEAGRDRSFAYGKLLKRKKYFAVIGLLVLVDWVANVPVFQQLLPQEPGAEQAWLDLADRATRYGSFSGIVRTFERLVFQPEVSLLAFGVVTFLMLLGHFLGSALRRIVAFRPKDESTAVLGLKSHRRQAWLPVIGGFCGIVLVVSFLFFSRAKLSAVTAERLDGAQRQVEMLQGKIQQATHESDLDRIQSLQRKLADAQALLDTRTEAADYAKSISNMNPAIFLLNLTLVIIAILAAYLESSAAVSEARWADPGITNLERTIDEARAEVFSHRQTIRRLSAEIQSNIAGARYLAQVVSLRDWQGKARRLEAVIPLFRTENARLRGIDVQNILAFKEPCRRLDLPEPVDGQFDVSSQLDLCERDFIDFRTQMSAASLMQ